MLTIRDGQRQRAGLPPLDFDLLLAHALRRPKEFLYTHPEYRPTIRERMRLAYGLFRYRRGWSVAALTRHKEFYGRDFYVNRHVLIPRPETELIVDEVIKELINNNEGVILIDVGTGSGCIPIAIAKTLPPSNKTIKIFATDISRVALRVARRNARTHRVPIAFRRGNLLTPIIISYLQTNKLTGRRIIITANLPYLTPAEFAAEPSIKKEPRHALVADKNGLALYEKLLKQIQSLLPANACPLQIFLEISPAQSLAITDLVHQLLPQAVVEIKTDLAGRERVAKIMIPNC